MSHSTFKHLYGLIFMNSENMSIIKRKACESTGIKGVHTKSTTDSEKSINDLMTSTVYILFYCSLSVVHVLTLLQSSLVMLPPVVVLLAVLSESVGLTLMTSMGIPKVEAHTCITWNRSSFELIWSLCSQATSFQLHKHVSRKHVDDEDSLFDCWFNRSYND